MRNMNEGSFLEVCMGVCWTKKKKKKDLTSTRDASVLPSVSPARLPAALPADQT